MLERSTLIAMNYLGSMQIILNFHKLILFVQIELIWLLKKAVFIVPVAGNKTVIFLQNQIFFLFIFLQLNLLFQKYCSF